MYKLFIESTVLSRIEYYNSLYHKLPLYSINCINRFIRSSVRLLFRIQLCDHSCTSDKLYGMKWLSTKQRLIYKIIMIVYKCIYLKSPTYLKDFLIYRIESRSSRIYILYNLTLSSGWLDIANDLFCIWQLHYTKNRIVYIGI